MMSVCNQHVVRTDLRSDCGDPVDVAADADPVTRFLALVGRNP